MAIQIISSPWIITKQLKQLIGTAHWIKNQLFWFDNQVSFSDSISVFLHWTFCTHSTGTNFKLYYYMKYGFWHNRMVIQIISSPWIITKQLKQLIRTTDWIKNQLFWCEIQVSFYDSISVFLHWTFCTASTGTDFKLYYYMKYGFGHNRMVIQIIPSPWIITKQLKQLIETAHWKKKLFWFEIEVSFYDAISVFLH